MPLCLSQNRYNTLATAFMRCPGNRLTPQELAFQWESIGRTPIHTPPPRSGTMNSARILSTLGILAFTSLLLAQAPPPTAYTITSALAGPDPGTMTVYRNGSMALTELNHPDRKSTRLNSSHLVISYAVFCLKKKTK